MRRADAVVFLSACVRRRSVPVPLGVPPEGVGEIGISLASPNGAFYKIDAAAEIGEPRTAGDAVDGVVSLRLCKRG